VWSLVAESFRVVAPGKLMLAGEYSVLGGAGQALALAVEPGIEVTYEPAAAWSLHRVDTEPGATEPGAWTPGQEIPSSLRFAHEAWKTVLAEVEVAPGRITTRTLGATGTGDFKPGVGGSASVTVAVVHALLSASGASQADSGSAKETTVRLALGAHHAAQGGRGSGYDIATIAHGGVVRWRPSRLATAGAIGHGAGASAEVAGMAWPDGLFVVAGYSGRSADTRALLRRLEVRVAEDRAGEARRLMALGAPVPELADAFDAGSVPAILDALQRCSAALESWDQIGVLVPEVREMLSLAARHGAVGRVSGAGGGDSVLAFAATEATVNAVTRSWSAEGYKTFPLKISRLGVFRKNN
jgi:phosphomevalonate kinase